MSAASTLSAPYSKSILIMSRIVAECRANATSSSYSGAAGSRSRPRGRYGSSRALYRLVLEETDEGAPKVWCRSRSGPSLRDMRTRSRSFARLTWCFRGRRYHHG